MLPIKYKVIARTLPEWNSCSAADLPDEPGARRELLLPLLLAELKLGVAPPWVLVAGGGGLHLNLPEAGGLCTLLSAIRLL